MDARQKNYRYSLAITAIFRDEAPFLKEWIEFHREVGCEHFYLFNNLSADHYQKVLQPYVDIGVVELFSWPIEHYKESDWNETQCLAYERALHRARGSVKWLAILDADEFLFPSKEESLIDALAKYEHFGGVAVNWQIYGTSSVAKIPEGKLMIEMLTLKLPESAPVNHRIKSIVRPDFVMGCTSPHYVQYQPGYFQVNSDCVQFQGQSSPYVQIETLRINHYRARDEQYLHAQKIPRARKWWNLQTTEAWEELYQNFNGVPDEAIFRFIPRLRIRMRSGLLQLPLL